MRATSLDAKTSEDVNDLWNDAKLNMTKKKVDASVCFDEAKTTIKSLLICSGQWWNSNFHHLQRMKIQYCAKVMQTIIDEYRDNRDLSAIFEW